VHINPDGGLKTINRENQVRFLSFGKDYVGVSLLDKMVDGLGLEVDENGNYPDKAVLIESPGRTLVMSAPLDGVINIHPPESDDPTFALNSKFLKNLLSVFVGDVEVSVPEPSANYHGEKAKYVTSPLVFRGVTKNGERAYAILMPMHLGG
jgi:hypothetical protein